MSNEEKSEVKSSLRKELIIPGATLIIVLAGFYYNTNSTMEEHRRELSSLKTELGEKASGDDVRAIQADIREIRGGNQKIYELLLEKQK
jgi:hypothetical protein